MGVVPPLRAVSRVLSMAPVRRQDPPRLLYACLLAALVAVGNQWPLEGRQRARVQRPPVASLTPLQAHRLAATARRSIPVQVAAGLDVTAWAPEGLVFDPVALDFDDRGALYATSTTRVNMPLDIRAHPSWVPMVHALRTVDDLRAFYRRELAPERSATNGWLPDANNDGSRDWRDLAQMKERLYRIEDTNGDGIADRSQIMIEGFSADPTSDFAGGVLYHNGDLFLGASPVLWRLRDGDGDGFIDSQVAVSEGYNVHPAFGGHGISGVTLGPDGRIYWEVGDMGLDVVDRSGRRWSYPNQGAVLRANPDGSDFEVFATGIRNLQEFAFDDFGNLISVDNDGDHQGETERIVYLPEGSDSGWRANWHTAGTPIPSTTATTSGWTRGCSSPASTASQRTSRRQSRRTTRVRPGWRTTRAPHCRTNGGITSSSPASVDRRAAPGSADFACDPTAPASRWGATGWCCRAS